MKGHRIGYIRVSSFDQNAERQLEQVQVDRVFTDKASGKDYHRPALSKKRMCRLKACGQWNGNGNRKGG